MITTLLRRLCPKSWKVCPASQTLCLHAMHNLMTHYETEGCFANEIWKPLRSLQEGRYQTKWEDHTVELSNAVGLHG